jgi:condensin complex subunit 3
VIHSLLRVAEDLDEDEEMVSPSQIAMQLVDWTDPRRLVDLGKSSTDLEALEEDTSLRNANIHVDLATTIMTHMKKGSSTCPPYILTFRGGAQGVVQYAGQVVHPW